MIAPGTVRVIGERRGHAASGSSVCGRRAYGGRRCRPRLVRPREPAVAHGARHPGVDGAQPSSAEPGRLPGRRSRGPGDAAGGGRAPRAGALGRLRGAPRGPAFLRGGARSARRFSRRHSGQPDPVLPALPPGHGRGRTRGGAAGLVVPERPRRWRRAPGGPLPRARARRAGGAGACHRQRQRRTRFRYGYRPVRRQRHGIRPALRLRRAALWQSQPRLRLPGALSHGLLPPGLADPRRAARSSAHLSGLAGPPVRRSGPLCLRPRPRLLGLALFRLGAALHRRPHPALPRPTSARRRHP